MRCIFQIALQETDRVAAIIMQLLYEPKRCSQREEHLAQDRRTAVKGWGPDVYDWLTTEISSRISRGTAVQPNLERQPAGAMLRCFSRGSSRDRGPRQGARGPNPALQLQDQRCFMPPTKTAPSLEDDTSICNV